MADRDAARELARTSQEEDNWSQYKLLRNECTRLQKSDKKIYLEGMYNNIEKENDTGRLYIVLLSNFWAGSPVDLPPGLI